MVVGYLKLGTTVGGMIEWALGADGQGRIQDFQIEGAHDDYVRAQREVSYGLGPCRAQYSFSEKL